MARIALTGGIACGKSQVARILNAHGIETIDADDIVHEILPDPAERRRLAAEVFADPAKRRALEARLHPIVKRRIDDFLKDELKIENGKCKIENEVAPPQFSILHSPFSIRIAVIPLLFEVRWDGEYDIICTVRSEKATQVARLIETRGYTREEAEARLAAQMPVAEKAARSHYVIENDGTLEDLQANVDAFIKWLKERSCPKSTTYSPGR